MGTMNEDCHFYYRKLSNIPSTLTTIEYFISYNQSIILVENSTGLVMDIYTTEDNINLQTKCSYTVYGQLRNENLYIKLRPRTYRSAKCVLSKDEKFVDCYGKTKIQDFIPRNYAFSFGYICSDSENVNSIKGLFYNISIYEQLNQTECAPFEEKSFGLECPDVHKYMSFPNMLGHISYDELIHLIPKYRFT